MAVGLLIGSAGLSGPSRASAAAAAGTSLTLVANPAVSGTPQQFTAHLQLSGTAAPVAGQELQLWQAFSPTESQWVRTGATDVAGQAVFDYPSSSTVTTFFARFVGSVELSASDSALVTATAAAASVLTVSVAPTAVQQGGQVVVQARLTRQQGGSTVPVVGCPVQLWEEGPVISERIATGLTDSNGVAAFPITVDAARVFYAEYFGDSTLAPSTGGHAIVTTYTYPTYGAIGMKYRALGGAAGWLGDANGVEYDVPGGRAQDFVGGRLYWSPAFGAFWVHGLILQHYLAMGGPGGVLAMPTSDEQPLPGGRASNFANGAVFWSPPSGAWSMRGDILREYLATPGALRYPKYPLTDELTAPDGVGRYNHFTAGTSIYWTPSTGAHTVYGAIRQHWADTGWERNLGYPLTTELVTYGGRLTEFQNGTTYWSPRTGAWFVRGALRERFLWPGGTSGPLGFPVSDEFAVAGGMRSNFERGALFWNAATGVITPV